MGIAVRRRCEALLFDAIQQLAAHPEGPLTQTWNDVGPHIRGFTYNIRGANRAVERVRQAHVIFYRAREVG
jgi:hypothetical protein